MIELKTGLGPLYYEEPNAREEEDRLKIFDSQKRYFDYFSVDTILECYPTIDKFIEHIKEDLEDLRSAELILEYFGKQSWSASVEWTDLLEDIYGEDGFEFKEGKVYNTQDRSEITVKTILDNVYVNKIGDEYVFVCE